MVNTYIIGGTFANTGNALASVQFPRNGRIKQIQFSLNLASVANCKACYEVAKNRSTSQIGTTLATPSGVLGRVRAGTNVDAAGSTASQTNYALQCDEPVTPNDTLYLHGLVTGTGTGHLDIVIFVQEGS